VEVEVAEPPVVLTGTLDEPQPDAELDTRLSLWAVVFAGGIGTRFWPLSTPARPKQHRP